MINKDIVNYNQKQADEYRKMCKTLAREIIQCLPRCKNKIWHGAPVWFDDSNPLVGYSARKAGIQLMFWSGGSFNETSFKPVGNAEKFKAAGVIYTKASEINAKDIARWLKKSEEIQWDYKNIIKRKGKLVRLKWPQVLY